MTACQSIGPSTIHRDQFDYNQAISVSQKEQLLLNMVRLRYGEAPVFLHVASVIAQYSIEGQLGINAPGYDRPNNVGPPVAAAGTRYTDRPTITYQPLSGSQFASTLLAPVPLQAAFALVQSGWSIDQTLRSTVRTLNGTPARLRQADESWNPQFLRAVEAISRVRETAAGGLQLEAERIVWALNPDPDEPEQVAAAEAFRAVLGLDPNLDEYELIISAYAGNGGQITMTMSSVLDILHGMSAQFEVPAEHVTRGWTYPGRPAVLPGSIVVNATEDLPENVFVATRDRGYWFWVGEDDYASKRTFSFLAMLLTLSESGSAGGPLVTIGTGGS